MVEAVAYLVTATLRRHKTSLKALLGCDNVSLSAVAKLICNTIMHYSK
jgi:hypothetical protein